MPLASTFSVRPCPLHSTLPPAPATAEYGCAHQQANGWGEKGFPKAHEQSHGCFKALTASNDCNSEPTSPSDDQEDIQNKDAIQPAFPGGFGARLTHSDNGNNCEIDAAILLPPPALPRRFKASS